MTVIIGEGDQFKCHIFKLSIANFEFPIHSGKVACLTHFVLCWSSTGTTMPTVALGRQSLSAQ